MSSDKVWRGVLGPNNIEHVTMHAADYDALVTALAEAKDEVARFNNNLKVSIEMLHPSVREGCHLHDELDVAVVVMRLGSTIRNFEEANEQLEQKLAEAERERDTYKRRMEEWKVEFDGRHERALELAQERDTLRADLATARADCVTLAGEVERVQGWVSSEHTPEMLAGRSPAVVEAMGRVGK